MSEKQPSHEVIRPETEQCSSGRQPAHGRIRPEAERQCFTETDQSGYEPKVSQFHRSSPVLRESSHRLASLTVKASTQRQTGSLPEK